MRESLQPTKRFPKKRSDFVLVRTIGPYIKKLSNIRARSSIGPYTKRESLQPMTPHAANRRGQRCLLSVPNPALVLPSVDQTICKLFALVLPSVPAQNGQQSGASCRRSLRKTSFHQFLHKTSVNLSAAICPSNNLKRASIGPYTKTIGRKQSICRRAKRVASRRGRSRRGELSHEPLGDLLKDPGVLPLLLDILDHRLLLRGLGEGRDLLVQVLASCVWLVR